MAAGDLVGTRRAVQNYRDKDGEASSQYKYKLLDDLCEAIEERNQDRFTEILYQYDRTSRLDAWMTAVLVKVKNSIEAPEDEFA